jgi:HK97 gp10 family phage protein
VRIDLRFSGGAELARTLNAMAGSVSHAVKVKALTEAAAPIRSQAASMAPRDPTSSGRHLADNIVIGSVSRARLESAGRPSETVVEVGPALKPSDHFYGFFQEYGTVRHGAQPFMRPAFDANWQRSLTILQAALWREIRTKISPISTPTGFGARAA